MGYATRIVSALIVRAWVASKSGEVKRLPRPLDAPATHSGGFDSDRVLIFGGGPAVGWGVLSHEIALPGALGRALSRRTGRGADVNVVAIPRLKVASAAGELRELKLHQYNAIVITIGVNDAVALTALPSWRRDLTSTVMAVSNRSLPPTRIFVAGLHPIRSIPVFDDPLGSLADAHARRMNVITADVCALVPRATCVLLSAPNDVAPERFRDAAAYRHWAGELAERMAPQLLADHQRSLARLRSGSTGSTDTSVSV